MALYEFNPKQKFEEKYRNEKCYWGLNPNKAVLKLLDYKKSGTVLDLGVGEGKDALFLAKNGFDVTGVDISETGIKKFLELAKESKLHVRGIVEDITNFEFEKTYDIIISISTLHFFSGKELSDIIKKMKENTSEGGVNLITVFTVDDPDFKVHPEKMHFFQKNELKNFYNDWEILDYNEFLTGLEKHGKEGKLHSHGVAMLIARKKDI